MSNAIYYPPYYEKQYWYRLKNILDWWNEMSINEDEVPETPMTFTKQQLGLFMDDLGLSRAYANLIEGFSEDEEAIAKQEIADIFSLISKRFWYHYCFCVDEKLPDYPSFSNCQPPKDFLYKLFNVIEYTYKKYSKIIELYNENYATLMRQLETTTESGSRFNDTPQQAEVSLSYEDNVYTTNLTKSKSVTSADSNTPIVKIEEIMRNYRNILLEWLNEFDSLFVEEHNI